MDNQDNFEMLVQGEVQGFDDIASNGSNNYASNLVSTYYLFSKNTYY